MDASTFAVARLNEHRARELDRDLAHLAAQAARRAARGEEPAAGAHRRPLWRLLTFRRRPAAPCAQTGLALAGPSS